jgi:hypothetical protein
MDQYWDLTNAVIKLPDFIQGEEKLLNKRLLSAEEWTGSTELSTATHVTRYAL